MIIKKILEFRLSLTPNEIYSFNIENTVKQRLAKIFIGKCFKSSYILRILRIIRLSETYMSDKLDGSGSCDVCFEVEAIVYLKNEVVICTVRKIEPEGIIYADTENLSLQISQQPVFKEKEKIPVMINKVRYPIGQRISALAKQFMPIRDPLIIYQITKPMDESQIKQLDDLLVKVQQEEIYVQELGSKDKLQSYEFFKDLVLSAAKKSIQGFKKIKFESKGNDLSLLQLNGYVCRPPEIMGEAAFMHSKDLDKKIYSELNITQNTAFEVAQSLIFDYIMHLAALRELTEAYPDTKSRNVQAAIWKLYKGG